METKKILFADDDPEIREVLRLLLTSEGYTVAEASSGGEVLELLDGSVDLVILDVMMPGLGGYAVCAEIRRLSTVFGCACPVPDRQRAGLRQDHGLLRGRG